jgi:hypothetical protein
MTPSVNAETICLAVTHKLIAVIFHDVFCHTNLPEREVFGWPRYRWISGIWGAAADESLTHGVEEEEEDNTQMQAWQ